MLLGDFNALFNTHEGLQLYCDATVQMENARNLHESAVLQDEGYAIG